MSQDGSSPSRTHDRVGDDSIADSTSRIVARHQVAGDGLIAILEDIQEQHGYLPKESLQAVAKETGAPLVDIYGVATFYRSFSLTPRGEHLVFACLGTACHVNTAPMVVEALERELGIKAGQTTADGRFTLETVNCLGACALGPIVVVDGRYFPHVCPTAVRQILRPARAQSSEPAQVAAK